MNIKTCCGCPEGKEHIFCGCECHKKCEHRITRWDGVVPCTGREICNDCGKQLN